MVPAVVRREEPKILAELTQRRRIDWPRVQDTRETRARRSIGCRAIEIRAATCSTTRANTRLAAGIFGCQSTPNQPKQLFVYAMMALGSLPNYFLAYLISSRRLIPRSDIQGAG